MSNASVAIQAIANGPGTDAPPSFNGMDWLVVLNLGIFTAVAIIAANLAWEQIKHLWRNRGRDTKGHPVTIWRTIGLCIYVAATLRCGAGAAVLWRWDAGDPVGTAATLTLQRVIDPLALSFGLVAMLLFPLASPGFVYQLRRQPLPTEIWLRWRQLLRPAALVAGSLVAALCVVSLR